MSWGHWTLVRLPTTSPRFSKIVSNNTLNVSGCVYVIVSVLVRHILRGIAREVLNSGTVVWLLNDEHAAGYSQYRHNIFKFQALSITFADD